MLSTQQSSRSLTEAARTAAGQIGELLADVGPTEFPDQIWRIAADAGLLGLPFDPRFGGSGLSLPETIEAYEAFGYACQDAGVGFSLATQLVSTGVPLQQFGSATLREQYLPSICDGRLVGAHAITEPDSGSDAASLRTSAVLVDGSYLLSGRKQFITNAPLADLIVVYARLADHGISAFLVPTDRAGVRVSAAVDKMGLTRSPMSRIEFDDCRIPAGCLIGEPGAGLFILDRVMKWEILVSFSLMAGAMRRRLDRCVAQARQRQQFGRPIGSNQSISNKVVEMKIAVETARHWLRHTAERMQAGADVTTEVAITKLVVSEGNLRTALDAVQIFGGAGYLAETGLEAEIRDAVGGTIYSGSSEIQRNRIANMLGLPA